VRNLIGFLTGCLVNVHLMNVTQSDSDGLYLIVLSAAKMPILGSGIQVNS